MKTIAKMEKSKYFYLFAGMALAMISCIPFFALGQSSVITYHDQLDGELLTYILNAKYLFSGADIYPELMNGIAKAGMVSPAPLFVLLYKIFPVFTAFMITQVTIILVGFVSTYALCKEITNRKWIGFVCGVIFMMLPFYPVYGFCIAGQPMLWVAFLKLWNTKCYKKEKINADHKAEINIKFQTENSKKIDVKFQAENAKEKRANKTWLCLLVIVLYGMASSPVLVGFGCAGAALGVTVAAFIKKREGKWGLLIGTGLLGVTYVLCNLQLVSQILFPNPDFISHKSEMVLTAANVWDSFQTVFFKGTDYATSEQVPILILAAVACGMFFIVKKTIKTFPQYEAKIEMNTKKSEKSIEISKIESLNEKDKELNEKIRRNMIAMNILLGIQICLSMFFAVYHGSVCTNLRNHLGGLWKEFNADRVCWLMPVIWYMILALALCVIADCAKKMMEVKKTGKSVLAIAGIVLTAILCISALGLSLFHSNVKPNVMKLLKGKDYYALTWEQFFAQDLFGQIRDEIGLPQETYRVVSFGIYPAAAAYNGFYCLDGYSNNYSLAYKHEFRKVLAPELAKSEYLTQWFDGWGNRCYITIAESNNYYTFEKRWTPVSYDFDIDLEQLKSMGCDYIISAAYLMEADSMNVELIREEPFMNEQSWYRLYVYRLK